MPITSKRIFRAGDLSSFVVALFRAAGLEASKAEVVGKLLLEADLMGHSTHGLQLVPAYLTAADKGTMTGVGEPEVIADRGAVVTWDGQRLPGVWLTASGLDLAVVRAKSHGSATVVIRRSHHIGCLAAYLPQATDNRCMAIIASSDPSESSVAPFGGTRSVFTPNPVAIGIPTTADPILIDISASITTNGMTGRLKQEGKRFPEPWVLDADGNPSDDPAAVLAEPPGTILPIGGVGYGHKGYGLALMIEALTQGLGGYGRADGETDWGASIFIQVFDPDAFGGLDAFTRQSDWITEACRTNPPRPGGEPVRLPGERALARKRDALANGVPLYPGIMESLAPWAERFDVATPAAI